LSLRVCRVRCGGLAGGFVQEQRDRRHFGSGGAGQQFDLLAADLEKWCFDHLAVDLDPAAFDIELGLASGTAKLLGKAFGQAYRVGHVGLGVYRRETWRATALRHRAVEARASVRLLRVTSC